MSRVPIDQPLLPSVLDRLVDDDPTSQKEAPRSQTQLLRDLKQSVRRDLENLLNTRRRIVGAPAGLADLERSLVTYGVPDITGLDLASAGRRAEFTRGIEEVIRKYEPRFTSVRVQLLDNTDQTDRTLRFRIDALLRAEPAPEPVVFDTSLEPATGTIEVKRAGR
jgi:type VI secretion system protein ImpF